MFSFVQFQNKKKDKEEKSGKNNSLDLDYVPQMCEQRTFNTNSHEISNKTSTLKMMKGIQDYQIQKMSNFLAQIE